MSTQSRYEEDKKGDTGEEEMSRPVTEYPRNHAELQRQSVVWRLMACLTVTHQKNTVFDWVRQIGGAFAINGKNLVTHLCTGAGDSFSG